MSVLQCCTSTNRGACFVMMCVKFIAEHPLLELSELRPLHTIDTHHSAHHILIFQLP